MSEDKTIPKPHLPKPDGLEDSGLNGTRQKYPAKAVLPAVCPSQALVFDEKVKLCLHQAPVQKARFGSKGDNASNTKVSTNSFSGKREARGREGKEEEKEEENRCGERQDAAQNPLARFREMEETGSVQQTHPRCACTREETIPVE